MIFVMADLHGDANVFYDQLCQILYWEESDHIIVAGDAGLRYGSYVMGGLRNEMRQYPGTIIVMRGNHDARYWNVARQNPDKWVIDGEYAYEKKYPNIKYVRDEGGIYEIEGKKFLFVPGGYSVDKWYRLQNGYPWEPEEELSYAEAGCLFDLADSQEYDYVVSHVAPYALYDQLSDLFLEGVDQSTVSNYSEKLCDYFYDKHNWKHWWFGHYHADREFDENVTMVYRKVAVVE